MDDDRSRLDSLGISNRSLDRKSKRLFWIFGGLAAVLFLGGIIYTIVFYITLPGPAGPQSPGQVGVKQVPMPVPPTALFPKSGPGGSAVTSVETGLFSGRVADVRQAGTGIDLVLELTFREGDPPPNGVSLILSGPPRWVDGRQGASEGSLAWDPKRQFRKGDTLRVPIRFAVAPRTPNFDLYVSFTGGRGTGGKRYFLHFSGLGQGRSGG
jgi:hypothetical protein